VSVGFCLVAVAKIIKFIIEGRNINAFLDADLFDTLTVFASQILLLLLTYSLQHMFGSQLLVDIQSEEEKFSKAFHTSPLGMVITRFPEGEIIDLNNGFLNITGMAREDLFGHKADDFKFWLTKGDNSVLKNELETQGRIYGLEFQFMRKSGKIATCLLSAELLTINNEKCLLSSLDDITSRKEYELNLIASKEKAEESDRCKTAFLQNISHEIRTPLNAIVGFSSLLGDDDLDKESRKSYVDLITKSSEHLLTILNDIMEISNIEAGVSKFNKQEININILLNDLYKQFRYRAIEKGIDLRVVVDQSFRNPVIVTDSTKLIQVLSNLLNNALKFTEKGRIKYGYELKNNHIEFHVTDTGIGIPEDLFDKIFDRFYRIDTSPVKKYSGTGLGLAISKAFIELLGGEIWVKSTVGKGTTFYFTLPRVHF
jgi:PAS domain S-box-containing protein